MKILAIPFLLSALLYGQQGPVKVTPGAPAVNAPAAAAAPAPPISPDTVVAEVNGKKYTAADLDRIITMLPAQYQQMARSRPQLLSQVFLMQHLAEDAEKAGLDQKAPFKEQLEMSRLQVLSTAELSALNNNMQLTEEEEQKYYKENPDKFKEVKVRVIYVAFNPAPGKSATGGKQLLTEAEAEAKIEDLEKQVKGGADFGKLARENSDDKTSAAKDGEFGVIKQSSSYPPPIKAAVFALKQGEVSAPIKQPSGFYLLRADEVKQGSFTDSLLQIIEVVKKEKFQEWLKGVQGQYSVKIENQAYFASGVPSQLQQVR
jgi:parvulin-like peptidyl-prolyl isomerase